MKRAEVIGTVIGERYYQDKKWGQNAHDVGAWLTIIRAMLTRAEAAYMGPNGGQMALDEIRQLAAVAVACGEQHGFPYRTMFDEKGFTCLNGDIE